MWKARPCCKTGARPSFNNKNFEADIQMSIGFFITINKFDEA
jgi:hypothetical protein